MMHKTEVMVDRTVEKGLGPADALLQAGNPYGFQPLTMRILEKMRTKLIDRTGTPTSKS